MSAFWKPRLLKLGWKTGLILVILFSVVRFTLVLSANVSGNYQNVSFIFLAMIALTLFFLSKNGKQSIGLSSVKNWLGLLMSFLFGMLAAAMLYFIMDFLTPSEHAYAYIANTYKNLPSPLRTDRATYFLIYSGISMFFSPLGEEFFYRGVVHENFRTDLGDKKAAIIDSSAFSLVHLSHFGIVYTALGWQFLPFPALIWVISLFVICLGFNWSRKITGSIWGAVMAHATFNLTMNYFIFYQILV